MDPIKEKINQLRKLAIERKQTAQRDTQSQKNTIVGETNQQLTSTCETTNANNNSSMAVDESGNSSLVVYDDKPEANINQTLDNDTNIYETISEMSSSVQAPPETEINKLGGGGGGCNVPMSKYVNRIKDFYDKERTSSTESLGGKSVFSQKVSKTKPSMPTAPIAMPEVHGTNDSDVDDSSIMSTPSTLTNSSSRVNRPPNRYINNLLNNFATTNRADSVENLKRSNFLIQTNSQVDVDANSNKNIMYNSSNQVDKIKEKFAKINQTTNLASNQRNLTQLDVASRNLILDEKPKEERESEEFELRFPPNKSDTIKKIDDIQAPPATRSVKKYQRSKTSDLSDVIFVKNENGIDNESNKKEFNTFSNKTREFDDLFSKYGVDKKYSTENAIIKSTMYLDRIKPSNL
jgi:hypothetical protein